MKGKRRGKRAPKRRLTLRQIRVSLKVLFYGIAAKRLRKKNKGDNKKVLLVKRDGIGDFILFLPAARALREYYKDCKLVLCCSRIVKELAELTGLFDEIIAFDKSDLAPASFKKTYQRITAEAYDVLLHPTQPRNLEAETVAYWANAKEKIASVGERGAMSPKMKKTVDGHYDRLIETGERNMTMIQTANFLRGIGIADYKATTPVWEYAVPDGGMILPEKFFVVFLGGSIYNKKWPPERYREVAEHVQERTGWRCVLCGDSYDTEDAEAFSASSIQKTSLVGKTSLTELLYVLSKAKFVIGNDTSAIHMANALSVPALAVKGQFAGDKFYPYVTEDGEARPAPRFVAADVHCRWCTLREGGGYHCLGGEYYGKRKTKCIMRLGVPEVIAAVDELLDELSDKE